MGRKRPHTATYKGGIVFVQLKDGTNFIDRFVHRTKNGRVIFKEHTVDASFIDKFICHHAKSVRYIPNPPK